VTTRQASGMQIYEIRPRKDKCGIDLISDTLPRGRLSYRGRNAVGDAVAYAHHRSQCEDVIISVFDPDGNVIEAHLYKAN
jgi:hypothetical protein